MLNYTPRELEILQQLNLMKSEPKPQEQSVVTDEMRNAYQEASKGTIDSTLGILGNSMSSAFGDTLPKNLAIAGKNIVNSAVGVDNPLNSYFNEYINKQNQETALSNRELTDQAQQSTTKKVADTVGNLGAMVVPTIAGAVGGTVLSGNPIGGLVAGTGIATAIGAGGSTDEFEQRRREELVKANQNQGLNQTNEQIQRQLDEEQKSVFGKQALLQGATNLASLGIAGAIGKNVIGGAKAATRAMAVDVPMNAGAGYLDEQITGGALQSGPSEEMAKEKAFMGAAVGGVIGGGIAGIGGRNAGKQSNKELADGLAKNKHEAIASIPLTEDGAKKRIEYLTATNKDSNVSFEVRDYINDAGEVIPSRKQVYVIKEVMPEVTKVEDATLNAENNATNQNTDTLTNDYQSQVKKNIKERVLTPEELSTATPENVRYKSPEKLDNPQFVQREVNGKTFNTLADRDNAGRALTLEQALKEEQLYKQQGNTKELNSFEVNRLDVNNLDSGNYLKDWISNADKVRGTDESLITIDNINIKDRSRKGEYDPHIRAHKDGKSNMEMLVSLHSYEGEPFLKNIRELNNDSQFTFIRENNDHIGRQKDGNASHSIAVYVKNNDGTGYKTGYLDDADAKFISTFLDSKSVNSISARVVAEKMTYSKKGSDRSIQQVNKVKADGSLTQYNARTKLALQLGLNDNAKNLQFEVGNSKINIDQIGKVGIDKKITGVIDNTEKNTKFQNAIKQKEENTNQKKLAKEQKFSDRKAQVEENKNIREQVRDEKVSNEQAVKTNDKLVEEIAMQKAKQEESNISAEKLAEKQQKDLLIAEIKKEKPENFKYFETANHDDIIVQEKFKHFLDTASSKIMELDKNSINNKIKVLVDHSLNDKVFSKKELEVIKRIKEQNGDGPGTFYRNNKTGERYVFLNFDNIYATALDQDIQVGHYAKFVYAHEVMGHGAMSTAFKTKKELDVYLDGKLDTIGDGVKNLMVNKMQMYKRNSSTSLEQHRRNVLEEVIADLASGMVHYIDKSGEYQFKGIKEYAKEHATGKYADKQYTSIVKEFLDFIKTTINDLVGNDVFKTYQKTVDDLTLIKQELKEMELTLKTNTDEFKAIKSFKETATPDEFKMITSMAHLNDYRYTENANNIKDKANDLFGALRDKLPWVGTMWGKAQRNERFKVGFDTITRIGETAHSIESNIQKRLSGIWQDGKLGTKHGLSQEEQPKISEALFNTLIDRKIFTEQELVSKFGLNDRQVNAYKSLIETKSFSNDRLFMSELYKEARNLGLKNEEMYDKFSHIMGFDNYDDFLIEFRKDIDTLSPKFIKKLENLIAEKEVLRKEIYNFKILPTDKYFLFVKDNKGNTTQFEQFSNEFTARRFKEKILKNNENSNLQIVIDKTPVKMEDLNDMKNIFNTASKSYIDYTKQRYKSGESSVVPFDFFKTLFKEVDDVSKSVSLNIHLPKINEYIDILKASKEDGTSKIATELEKIRDAELSNDNQIASKIRGINSIWNLGGSIGSAVANTLSIPTIVAPYLSRYNGGLESLNNVKGMAFDSKIYSNSISKEDLINHIIKTYLPNADEVVARKDLSRLIEAGILKQIGDYDMAKIKDGRNITGVPHNAKTALINGFMLPFAKTEQLNRMMTGISALDTAYKNNMSGYEFARETVFSTQGYYGKAGRPAWARNSVGQLLYQFKTYPMNFTELMLNFALNGNKKDKQAALAMASILILAGGVKSLPFASDIGDVVDTTRRLLGDENADIGGEIDNKLKSLLGNQGSGLAMFGLMSEFGIPFNMQNRMSFANIVPGTNIFDPANKQTDKSLKEIGGPTASNSGNFIEAIKQFGKGNLGASLQNAAPSSVRSIYQGGKALVTGKFEDKKGNFVATATASESIIKMLGIQPSNLAETYRAIERTNIRNQNTSYVKSIVYDLYAESIIEKDFNKKLVANRIVAKYNDGIQLKDRLKINQGAITTRVNESKLTLAEKFKKRLATEVKDDYSSMYKK